MTSPSQDRLYGSNSSLAFKAPCRAATTGNITLSGEQTIDSVAVVTGDRVLVKDQTVASQNGIYIADTSTWDRAPDFDGNRDVAKGCVVHVTDGGTLASTYFEVTTNNPIVIDTTSIVFTQTFLGDATTVSFTQSGTGAVARTVQSKLRDGEVSLKDFGAACDGVTDDTAAFQLAVEAIGDTSNTRRSGMTLLIPGPTEIGDTIELERKSFTLRGNGWGRLDDANGRASLIRWAGAAGIPMLKLINCSGGMRIRDIALKGLTTAKPSAAIELNQTSGGIINSSNFFENIAIGTQGAGDDTGEQFTDGIISSGINATNAEQFFSKIYITLCSGIGIKQALQQNANWNLNDIDINQCGVGVQLASSARGAMWTFTLNDVDIKYVAVDDLGNICNPRCSIHRYFSEQSGRMLEAVGAGEFSILEGDFAISSSLNADGRIVSQTQGNNFFYFALRDFLFQQISAPSGSPHLFFRSSPAGGAPRHIILDGIRGWGSLTGGTNGLDITTQSNVDGAYVYLRQIDTAQQGFKQRVALQDLNGVTGRTLDITKYVPPYSLGSCRVADDFCGEEIDGYRWQSVIGTDAECRQATVLADQIGGVVRLTTGNDVGGTMALNGSQLQGRLNWQANRGGLTAEFRLAMNPITNLAVFFGFTDQVATLEMPFTLGAGDVLTSNATDAVGVLFDTGADTDTWWLVGVANDVDAAKENTAVAPTANAFEKWRIEVSSTGQAKFYRNGSLIGSTMAGAVRIAVGLTPVVAVFARNAASKTVDVDKILVEQDES